MMAPETVDLLMRMLTAVSDGYGMTFPDLNRDNLGDPEVVKAALLNAPIHNDPGTPEPILVALDGAVGAFTRLAKTCSAYIQDGHQVEDP